jgi:hypothetical protein
MSTSRILRQIAIKQPCTANWDEMRGNDQIRFCGHCDLSVTDLAQMTRVKAERLVRKSQGRLCLRIQRDPLGNIVTRDTVDRLYAISRRTSRIAAGAFTAVMSLSTAAYAQSTSTNGSPGQEPVAQKAVKQSAPGRFSYLFGTISDPNGAGIPNAQVSVHDENTGDEIRVELDQEGNFRVWLSGDHTYSIRVHGPDGFTDYQRNSISLRRQGDTRFDVELNVAGALLGDVRLAIQYQQPLVHAVDRNDLDEVNKLLRSGENVDQAEDDGTTALQLAVSRGNLEIVRRLLSAGAKVNAIDEYGCNVLFSLDDDSDAAMIALVMKARPDANQASSTGYTPLMHAAEQDDEELIRAFIQAGAKIDAQNTDGETALMVAAKEGNVEAVRGLLASEANVHILNSQKQDALQLAEAAGNAEVVELLKTAGAVPRQ